MYNRYIPEGALYTQVKEEPAAAPEAEAREVHNEVHEEQDRRPDQSRPSQGKSRESPRDPVGLGGLKPPGLFGGKDGLAALFSGRDRGGLASLLKTLRLDGIDTGDVLLLLIILYLLVEGDDLELVIALGLVLIMGLGDKEENENNAKGG